MQDSDDNDVIQSAVDNEYSELDKFLNNNEPSDETEETESEEMSEEDAAAAAGFFVDTGAGFVESMFSVPVTIDHDTKQVIASKAVPVVLKYAKGASLPPWLVKYREECELIAVLATAGFSIYQQIKMAKIHEKEKQYDKGGEVKVSAA